MNTNKNYFELIDSYLNGQMTASDAIDFESQLAKDPLLDSEFQLQKDIIKSIREFRKAELKETLNLVDVGVGGGTFTSIKIAAGIAAMVLIGSGIYYFSPTNSDTTAENQQIVDNQNPVLENQLNETDDNNLVAIKPLEDSQSDDQTTVSEETVTKSVTESVTTPDETNENNNPAGSKTPLIEQPDIDLPEVFEDFDNTPDNNLAENLTVPENKLNQATETVLPKTEVVEVNKGKFAFHYQFYSNKLYLYGQFDNKYEILELNTPDGISIYMFYQDKFYELVQNQRKITPLTAIKDITVIEDLKTIKEN